MKTATSRTRQVICAAALLTLLPLTANAAPAPQGAPALQGASVSGGVVLQQRFVDLHSGYLESQNAQHRALLDHPPFREHLAIVNQQLELFDLKGVLVAIGSALFPGLLGTTVGMALELVVSGICGSTEFEIGLVAKPSTICGTFQLAGLDATLVDNTLVYEIDLADIGILYELETSVGIGDGVCAATDVRTGKSVFPGLHYRAQIAWDAQGELATSVQLTSPLTPLDHDIEGWGPGDKTALLFYLFGNLPIQGKTLDEEMLDFALITVPAELTECLGDLAVAYLPVPGGVLELHGAAQANVYAQELIAGQVIAPVFEPGVGGGVAGELRRGFTTQRSPIGSGPSAACFPDPQFTSMPQALPPLTEGNPTTMGTVWFGIEDLLHPLRAAQETGLGTDIASFGLSELAPELAAWGLGDALLSPNSPAVPIPLAPQQIVDLATLIGSGTSMDTPLTIRICPLLVVPQLAGIAGPQGSGVLQHLVALEADFGAAHELFTAVYFSDVDVVHRGSSQGQPAAIELRPRNTRLTALQTVASSGVILPSTSITSATAVADAPVSLLLRALFGDAALASSQSDERVRLVLEGLTASRVQRAAQLVRLPCLDFPAHSSGVFGVDAALASSWAAEIASGEILAGFALSTPQLCAHVMRWGSTASKVGGQPNPNWPKIQLDVEWIAWDPSLYDPMATPNSIISTLAGVPSTRPQAGVNPSRYDDGYVHLSAVADFPGDAIVRLSHADGIGFEAPDASEVTHYVVATAAGVQRVRGLQQVGALPAGSIELLPYRGLAIPCGAQVPPCPPIPCPVPDVIPPAPCPTCIFGGYHHGPGQVALVVDAEFHCSPRECKGSRAVWRHAAPLLWCGNECLGSDDRALLVEQPARFPPDLYIYDARLCEAKIACPDDELDALTAPPAHTGTSQE